MLVAAAGILAAGSLALATPALAADNTITGGNTKHVHDIDQGATVNDAFWTYRNTGPSLAGATALTGTGTITFHAPAGTTFVEGTSELSSGFSSDDITYQPNADVARGCVIGSNGTQMSCPLVQNGVASSTWGNGFYFRYQVPLTAAPDATPGVFSGAVEATFNTADGGTVTVNDGTLDVNIRPAAGTPMINPTMATAVGGLGVTALSAVGAVVLIRRRKAALAS